MPEPPKKPHLLDIRQQAVFNRIQTRCGRFKKGQNENRISWAREIKWLDPWKGMVDIVPKEGKDYCKICLRIFESEDGYADYKEYKDRIDES